MAATTLKLEGDVPTIFIHHVYEVGLGRAVDEEGFASEVDPIVRTTEASG